MGSGAWGCEGPWDPPAACRSVLPPAGGILRRRSHRPVGERCEKLAHAREQRATINRPRLLAAA
jgi:hypothetical protein